MICHCVLEFPEEAPSTEYRLFDPKDHAGHWALANCPDCFGEGLVNSTMNAVYKCNRCERTMYGEDRRDDGSCPHCVGQVHRLYCILSARPPKPLTLSEAIEKARGGPAPIPRQGFA